MLGTVFTAFLMSIISLFWKVELPMIHYDSFNPAHSLFTCEFAQSQLLNQPGNILIIIITKP